LPPGDKNRLKGYTRKHTCTAAVPDTETVAEFWGIYDLFWAKDVGAIIFPTHDMGGRMLEFRS